MKMSVEKKSGCLICGEDLVYKTYNEKLKCYYCSIFYDSYVKCNKDHFVCDKCHSLSANEIIEKFALNTELLDPLEIALILMRNPKIKMHGPEHHFLVPAVLLTSYYNIQKHSRREKERKIKEAKKRALNILGGFCGFYGVCGAAVGTGIFMSLVTNSTPLSIESWRLSNLITAKSLSAIANNGGPRCCKRNTYLALIEAVIFLRENCNINMTINPNLKCEYYDLNKECLKSKCMFYE